MLPFKLLMLVAGGYFVYRGDNYEQLQIWIIAPLISGNEKITISGTR